MKATEIFQKFFAELSAVETSGVELAQANLDNGTVLEAESFEAGQPIFIVSEEDRIAVPVGEYQMEDGRILVVVEEGVIGMIPGETREIFMPADKAYGPYLKEKVFEFHKDRISEGMTPEVGQQMQLYRADGMPIAAKVVDKTETGYIMDANHALAGQSLIFDVTLEEIVAEDA